MTGADVITGGEIVGTLLRAYPPLVALIAEANIKLGRLPADASLPAALVAVVSSVERQPLKRGAYVRRTDRVAVTVRAATHRDRKLAIRLIRLACAGRTGTVAGAARVAVLTAGTGPEVDGPGNSFEQTQDLKVSFDDPTF